MAAILASTCLLGWTPAPSTEYTTESEPVLVSQQAAFGWNAGPSKTKSINAKTQQFRVYTHPLGIEVLSPEGSLVTTTGDVLTIKKPGCSCEYVVTAYSSLMAAQQGGIAFIRQAETQLKRVPDYYSPKDLAKARVEMSGGRPVYFNDWIPGNDSIGCQARGDAGHAFFYYCHNHTDASNTHFTPGGLEINLK